MGGIHVLETHFFGSWGRGGHYQQKVPQLVDAYFFQSSNVYRFL